MWRWYMDSMRADHADSHVFWVAGASAAGTKEKVVMAKAPDGMMLPLVGPLTFGKSPQSLPVANLFGVDFWVNPPPQPPSGDTLIPGWLVKHSGPKEQQMLEACKCDVLGPVTGHAATKNTDKASKPANEESAMPKSADAPAKDSRPSLVIDDDNDAVIVGSDSGSSNLKRKQPESNDSLGDEANSKATTLVDSQDMLPVPGHSDNSTAAPPVVKTEKIIDSMEKKSEESEKKNNDDKGQEPQEQLEPSDALPEEPEQPFNYDTMKRIQAVATCHWCPVQFQALRGLPIAVSISMSVCQFHQLGFVVICSCVVLSCLREPQSAIRS